MRADYVQEEERNFLFTLLENKSRIYESYGPTCSATEIDSILDSNHQNR